MKLYSVIEKFTGGNEVIEQRLGSYKTSNLAYMAISEFAHQHVQLAKLFDKRYKLQESKLDQKASVQVGNHQYEFTIVEI